MEPGHSGPPKDSICAEMAMPLSAIDSDIPVNLIHSTYRDADVVIALSLES